MQRLVRVLALLALVACASSGQWSWRRADGAEDPDQLREDIDVCETHARISRSRGFAPAGSNARPYGGWGDFVFEACMHEKKWDLKYVRPDGSRGAAPPSGAEEPSGR